MGKTFHELMNYEHYLPTAYDESLSLLQKMNKTIHHLQSLGELSCEMVKKWNEVYEWVMGSGLEQAVSDLLNEWYDSGKFDGFFTEVVEEIKILRQNAFVDNISTRKEHFNDGDKHTSVWFVDIPYLNEDGSKNILKRGFANDKPNGGFSETARTFSDRHHASLVVNASTYNTDTFGLQGTQVLDGVVLAHDTSSDYKWSLGMKEDGTLHAYPPKSDVSRMISDGMVNVLSAFYPLIMDYRVVTPWTVHGDASLPHPRQIIAQRTNNDYVVMTTAGRLAPNYENGLTLAEATKMLQEQYGDIRIAFMLDGGGSTQTVTYGTMLNNPLDSTQQVERKVPDFLYFALPPLSDRDKDIYNAYKTIGYVRKEVSNLKRDSYYNVDNYQGYFRLRGPSGYSSHGVEVWEGSTKQTKLMLYKDTLSYYDYAKDKSVFKVDLVSGDITTERGTIGNFLNIAKRETDNINTVNISGIYWISPTVTGNPDGVNSYGVQHIEFTDRQNAIQIGYSFKAPVITKSRIKTNGVWSAWS